MASPGEDFSGENFANRLTMLASPIFYFSRNWISLIGVAVTTSTFFTLVVLYLLDFYSPHANPYIGIVAYLILPAIFLLGLLLIPLGMALMHHREVRQGILPHKYPRIDFNRPELRRVFSFVVLATTLNGLVLTTASYRSVKYMDSVSFCGETCHTVMKPEFAAYQDSPHSRVECVVCHIGPGASWFVRSKLSGVGQVVAVALNTFPRPIPTPIRNLRPARETCEQCHWPSRFAGYLLAVRPHYDDDETNHATKTVLSLNVGGGRNQGAGIHTVHVDLASQITYLTTDGQRQQIPWVRYESVTGELREYSVPGWDGDMSRGELRVMDCMDCHNRPTHTYQLPERAVDEALAAGQMDPSLPFLKKKSLELLQQTYPTQQAALDAFPRELNTYYEKNFPQIWKQHRASVELSAKALQQIYGRNVFPEMAIGWGTYPNNIGHMDFPGCFRCHDDEHASKEGAAITQDCNTCHIVLASEEENPAILEELTVAK